MPTNCPTCNAGVVPTTPSIKCNGNCKKRYHLACLDVNLDAIDMPTWICHTCSPESITESSIVDLIQKQFSELKKDLKSEVNQAIREAINEQFKQTHERIERMEEDITTLKLNVSELKNSTASENVKKDLANCQQQIIEIKAVLDEKQPQSVQGSPILEEVVQEVLERNKRSRNIIIYNVPEQASANNSKDERLENEKTIISEILNVTHNSTDPSEVIQSFQRLGRYNKARIRPLRVILRNDTDVLNIIRGTKNLQNHGGFTNIRISFDRTPRQLEMYQQLRQQLETRTASGETNLKIRYVNGTPRIVTLN
ncbi:hypothetical protein Zmor_012728 [Zophobas morio]|uniref:PHD-type domain-containing protein n=1 Tax=Zophobas morio TaxID=2755281 RepID=A0AA38IE41_9CUCU|nr:hypothetical protein Zmor_012728 [Zophobas morio]